MEKLVYLEQIDSLASCQGSLDLMGTWRSRVVTKDPYMVHIILYISYGIRYMVSLCALYCTYQYGIEYMVYAVSGAG